LTEAFVANGSGRKPVFSQSDAQLIGTNRA
jgi:hypothetical protein